MPKLSIVIPTKNRYETLFPVVRSLLKYIKGSDYEIVIHDNSDNNEVAIQFLADNRDLRIAYYYTTETLTQSGNSNAAIARSVGDYVIFIGDDDFVSPYILDAVDIMAEKNINCLSYSIGSYYWQTVRVTNLSRLMKPSLLFIQTPLSCNLIELDSQTELQRVLDNGGTSIWRLTRLYHGIVSRKVLNKLMELNGTYAVGSCPDMNIAITISSFIKNYSFVNYPLSISGVSSKSAAGMDARNAHRAELQVMVDSGFLPEKVIKDWNPLLPKVWTIPTIYAQALYEALKSVDIKKEINYTAFFSIFFWREYWAKKYGFQALKYAVSENKTTKIKVLFAYCKFSIRRRMSILLKPFIGRLINKEMPILINDVVSADQCMQELLKLKFIK